MSAVRELEAEARIERMSMLIFLVAAEDQDRRLFDKFVAELDGILQWAIQGCLEWQESACGFHSPRTLAPRLSVEADQGRWRV